MEKQQGKHGLQDARVVILGGTSGLGLATAIAASEQGARVVVVSSNQQRVNKALQELPAGSEGHAVNLSDEAMIRQFFNRTGNFDHLIYTAGENISLATLAATNIPQARDYFTLRYWGAFAAVKYAAPLINAGGSICLTGGIASLRPGTGWSLGASICGAMEGFMRAMAVELAPIRVNLVSPGVVRTNLWDSLSAEDRDHLYTTVGNTLPVKRVGEAADIAKAFVYLMQQDFCTGQTLVVDGGTVLV